MRHRRQIPRTRTGHSLLELIAASTIAAIVIVSTLNLMRESMELSRDLESRSLVATLGMSMMEQHLGQVSAVFTTGPGEFDGSFQNDGREDIRFVVTRSDSAADGGIPDRLMVVTTTVWEDINGNRAIDRGEPRVEYASKVADLTAWDPGIRN